MIKIGDKIYINAACSLSLSSEGFDIVTDIKTRYRNLTGKPYSVICTETQEFDGETGLAITPPLACYIKPSRGER